MFQVVSIRAKLFTCLGLFAAAILALVAIFTVTARSNDAALNTILADRVVPLGDLKAVADNYAVDIVDASHKARNGNVSMENAARAVSAGRDAIRSHWSHYRETSIDGEEAQLAATVEEKMAGANAAIDRLHTILQSGDRAALDRFVVSDLYRSIDPVSTSLGELIDIQIRIASETTSSAISAMTVAQVVAVAIALAAAAVWGFAFLLTRSGVVRPINLLGDAMDRLASEEKGFAIPYTDRADEMGRIARAVDLFRQAAVDRAAADARTAAEQQAVTSTLAESLVALSKGDLTAEVKVEFPPAYAELRSNFNAALVNLRALIGTVAESAHALRTGSGEIAQASEDLARRTESNAASLEETSAALAQIDGRIKATAEAAGRTVSRADQAISAVSGGRTVADEAVQAMGRVRESAKGIDEVIEGVDKIAFQTRVLAMNAAVEAGRAGDAGRGFAVVADLVSALAMRAEEEAKRARDQLTVTQTDIVTAVEAVQRIDSALTDISTGVGEVHELLGSMASDNQAQASAITQISTAVTQMDQSTQQNAAMVEETSAAARNLNGEVEILAEKAGQFRVDAGTAPARTVPRPAAKAGGNAVPAKTLPLAIMAKANGNGANHGVALDDWNDF